MNANLFALFAPFLSFSDRIFLFSLVFDKVMSVCCVVAGGGGTLALIIMAGVDIQFPVGVRIIKN